MGSMIHNVALAKAGFKNKKQQKGTLVIKREFFPVLHEAGSREHCPKGPQATGTYFFIVMVTVLSMWKFQEIMFHSAASISISIL